MVKCDRCGAELSKRGKCSNCYITLYMRSYYKTEKGKANIIKAIKKYRVSEKGKSTIAKAVNKYKLSKKIKGSVKNEKFVGKFKEINSKKLNG